MNGSIRVSAKTVDDAITEALIQLGVTSDRLEYEVIEKGSAGFLGIGMKQAVIEAGAVRTTPILLTAGTVVIGAFVILFDPIFQGLAISLMGGTIVSTVLTLIVVPLVYYMIESKKGDK